MSTQEMFDQRLEESVCTTEVVERHLNRVLQESRLPFFQCIACTTVTGAAIVSLMCECPEIASAASTGGIALTIAELLRKAGIEKSRRFLARVARSNLLMLVEAAAHSMRKNLWCEDDPRICRIALEAYSSGLGEERFEEISES